MSNKIIDIHGLLHHPDFLTRVGVWAMIESVLYKACKEQGVENWEDLDFDLISWTDYQINTINNSITQVAAMDILDPDQPVPPAPTVPGWTPDNPIDITEEQFMYILEKGIYENGYFYNVTDGSIKYLAGLYIIDSGNVYDFDTKNSMTKEKFTEIIGNLTKNTIYYITDGEEVCRATDKSAYTVVQRGTHKPSGETPEDPIMLSSSDELAKIIAKGQEGNGYFYYITNKQNLLIVVDEGEYTFNPENSMYKSDFETLCGKSELIVDEFYYIIDDNDVYIADTAKTFKIIERVAPSFE